MRYNTTAWKEINTPPYYHCYMVQCEANTRRNQRCNRTAISGQRYCWQHINGWFNKLTYGLSELLGVKRRFIIWLLLFSIVVFFLQGYANYQYNQILDNLKMKADVGIEISPYLYKASFGEYLPLIVTNTGDYTLKDVHIFVSTCEMLEKKYFEHYSLPLLPSHSERQIPFGNKETITTFKSGNCYPFSGAERSYPSFSFNPFHVMQGENYTSISTGCGVCYFNATVIAEYYEAENNQTFKKKIRSYFDFPVDLAVSISSGKE